MDVDELMRGDFLDDKSDEEGEEAASDGDDELLDGVLYSVAATLRMVQRFCWLSYWNLSSDIYVWLVQL
jgi:hypothetical protein